jgi:hypothetical protein
VSISIIASSSHRDCERSETIHCRLPRPRLLRRIRPQWRAASRKDGTFVKEWFYEKNTRGNGAVWDVAIWPDPKQTYLLSADGENNEIRVLKRDDGTVVGSFGRGGRQAGQFHWIHAMAVDAQGNVYTAEVDTGKRIQKFKLTSDARR